MKKFPVSLAVLLLASSQPSFADDPTTVGVVTGQYFYEPPDVGPQSGEEFYLGDSEGSVATYTLTAGQVNTLVRGTVGTPEDSAPNMTVGSGLGANATLTVTGTGAAMRLLADDYGFNISIGSQSTGSVFVTNGGLLEVLAPSNVSSSSASIQMSKINGDASLILDDGTVNISSPLDAFLFAGALQSDDPIPGGTSFVSLSNGSNLNVTALAPISPPPGDDTSAAAIILGQAEGSDSTVIVDDSTVVVAAEEGFAGLSIAREAGSTGEYTLRNGSVMTLDANSNGVTNSQYSGAFIQIGRDQGTSGLLRIETGAHLIMTSRVDEGFVGIGSNDGAFGQLIVESGGSLTYASPLQDGFMQVGQDDPGTSAGGVGLVTVSGSGSLLGFDGTINAGKTAGTGSSTGIITVSNEGVISSTDVNIYDGGILRGSGGTVDATVSVFDGGLLAPGTSPGTLDILGDLILESGSNLEIEIAGTASGQFDVLNIFGDLIANDTFSLTFSFLDGFLPEEGSTFEFLNVSGDIQGFFDLAEIDFFGIGSANLLFADQDGRVSVSFSDVAAVPVPMSALLLISGLGVVTALGCRKNRKVN